MTSCDVFLFVQEKSVMLLRPEMSNVHVLNLLVITALHLIEWMQRVAQSF